MNLAEILQAIAASKVIVSRHAREEAEEDGLLIDEVCFSLEGGEIIQEYPEDRPYPSCLVYGLNAKGEPIHSVWAYNTDNGWAVLVTVYRPDPKLWIDWRTRRKL